MIQSFYWAVVLVFGWTDPTGWNQLVTGMTDRQVIDLIGRPKETETVGGRQVWYYQDLPNRDSSGRMQVPPQNGFVVFDIQKEGRRETLRLSRIRQPDLSRVQEETPRSIPSETTPAKQADTGTGTPAGRVAKPQFIEPSNVPPPASVKIPEPAKRQDPASTYFLWIGGAMIAAGIAFAIIRPLQWLNS